MRARDVGGLPPCGGAPHLVDSLTSRYFMSSYRPEPGPRRREPGGVEKTLTIHHRFKSRSSIWTTSSNSRTRDERAVMASSEGGEIHRRLATGCKPAHRSTVTFDAFFHREGGRFVPTELTRGPWSADAQHGGPPAALLRTVLEATERRDDSMIVRGTFEMLKPVPLAPLTVATRVLNAGRSVQVLGGTISAGSEEILRGEALRIRTTDLSFPEPPLLPAVPGPDRGKAARFFPTGYEVGYHTGMENSFVRGGFLEEGPASAWL